MNLSVAILLKIWAYCIQQNEKTERNTAKYVNMSD